MAFSNDEDFKWQGPEEIPDDTKQLLLHYLTYEGEDVVCTGEYMRGHPESSISHLWSSDHDCQHVHTLLHWSYIPDAPE